MEANLIVEYVNPFNTRIDEEPIKELIDKAWMAVEAPAEYAKAKDEHSDYLGCTYKEATLRDIGQRAMAWFAADGNSADLVTINSGTDNAKFDADLRMFFANVQASAYCRALSKGADGKQAMQEAKDALFMVATPYRDWLAEWVDEIFDEE